MAMNLAAQQKEHLKELLQHAQTEAVRVRNSNAQEGNGELERLAVTAVEMIAKWIKAIDDGSVQIEHRPVGVGMGISRGVSEWCDDEALLNAVFSAEDYFLALQESP